jgi:hypothetical protein
MVVDWTFFRRRVIMSEFMFATGVEHSYPTIEWEGKNIRQDELAKTKHYQCWRDDFRPVQELGIHYLRYGPPYFSTHTGAARPAVCGYRAAIQLGRPI